MKICLASKRRSIMAWVVLVAMGLRCLIPTGYMPDFSGHALLVACDGTDHMAHMHHGGHGSHGHEHGDVCPFGAAGIYSFAGIKASMIKPPVFARAIIVFPAATLLAQHADFGNASPRSPPLFS